MVHVIRQFGFCAALKCHALFCFSREHRHVVVLEIGSRDAFLVDSLRYASSRVGWPCKLKIKTQLVAKEKTNPIHQKKKCTTQPSLGTIYPHFLAITACDQERQLQCLLLVESRITVCRVVETQVIICQALSSPDALCNSVAREFQVHSTEERTMLPVDTKRRRDFGENGGELACLDAG